MNVLRLGLLCAAMAFPIGILAPPLAAQIPTIEEMRREIPPAVIAANDSPLRKLLKERFNVALEETMALETEYRAGRIILEDLVTGRSRLATSGLELAETSAERIKQLELAFTAAKRIEELVQIKYDDGGESLRATLRAKGMRLDADIALLREREAAQAKTPNAEEVRWNQTTKQ
jgi:hypothetical protein